MPRPAPSTSQDLAERHEALWLRLTALHHDTAAIAAKKPDAPVSDTLRIAAESLLADAVPFLPYPKMRLPVAAPELMGLSVQLGQALAWLDAWEARHAFWNAAMNCRCWRIGTGSLPVMRLRPQVTPPAVTPDGTSLREKFLRQVEQRRSGDFERGFAAGRAARDGKPVAEIVAGLEQTYPHLRRLE